MVINPYKRIIIRYADIRKMLDIINRGLKSRARDLVKPITVPQDQILEFDDLMMKVLDKLSRSPIYFKDTKMSLYVSQKVIDILTTDDDQLIDRDMRELILVFIDNLKTVMKKHGRFAFVILLEDDNGRSLFLGHSEFEKTSTIDEKETIKEIKIVEQFLGPSALYRAVRFVFDRSKNDFAFTYYEKTKSESFRKFLGISEVETYEIGNIRIRVNFFNETDVDFNFTFEQFREILENKRNIKIDVDRELLIYQINDTTYWPFSIKEIMLGGRKKFKSIKKFVPIFKRIIEGVDDVILLYEQIMKEYLPFADEIIEYEDRIHLRKIKSGYENVIPSYINKPRISYITIFATREKGRKLIVMDNSFARFLAQYFLSGYNINIFHVGVKYSYLPAIDVLNLRIFNEISLDGAILSIINQLVRYIKDSKSIIITQLLRLSILRLLALALNDPLKYVFEEISKESIMIFKETINAADISLMDRESINEQYAVDFKRIDILSGRLPEHLEILRDKYSLESINIYWRCVEEKAPNLFNLTIIGFDEAEWRFKGSSKIKNENIEIWEKEVKNICIERNEPSIEVFIFPIPIKRDRIVEWALGVITFNIKGLQKPTLDIFFA